MSMALKEAYLERAGRNEFVQGLSSVVADRLAWRETYCALCKHWGDKCQLGRTAPQCGHFQAR